MLIANRSSLSFSILFALAGSANAGDLPPELRKSLTFSATFDSGFDAELARGDARLHSAKSLDRKAIDESLSAPGVKRVTDTQRSGQCLHFEGPNKTALFFKAAGNMPYRPDGPWSGTVSYFLKVDPAKDLPPDFVDPLQITEKAWNDAAFWNDFTKDDRPRKFRLGILPDLKHWNPKGDIDFDKLPDAEKPAIVVADPPFRGQWVHVLFTFENFNSGKSDATARLYLDGELAGEAKGRNQKYTWDPAKTVIFIGINYGGKLDDLMIFDRAITAEEAKTLAAHGSKR
ncbi:hypothetical protein GC170_20130 [bacterium]|nr:hypothetical protein [bacterium]